MLMDEKDDELPPISLGISKPIFSRPIVFNIPEEVSIILGTGFPVRGFIERPLVQNPPNLFKSTNSENSSPYPKVPEAAITGFANCKEPRFTDKSIFVFLFIATESINLASQ